VVNYKINLNEIQTLIFEPGTECNYNCTFCRRKEKLCGTTRGIPSQEQFERVTLAIKNECPNINRIILGSQVSETLSADKYVDEKLLFMNTLWPDAFSHVKTNGFSLNTISLEALFCLNFIRVSFYGWDRESYQKIHNIDAFDRVLSNVKTLLLECKKHHPKTTVGFRVLHRKYRPTGNEGLDYFDREAFQKFYQTKVIELQNLGAKISELKFYWPEGESDIPKEQFIDEYNKVPCPMYSGLHTVRTIRISWEGDLGVCHYDWNGIRLKLIGDPPNIIKHGVLGAINHATNMAFAKAHQTRDFDKLPLCTRYCELDNRQRLFRLGDIT